MDFVGKILDRPIRGSTGEEKTQTAASVRLAAVWNFENRVEKLQPAHVDRDVDHLVAVFLGSRIYFFMGTGRAEHGVCHGFHEKNRIFQHLLVILANTLRASGNCPVCY